MGISTTVTSSFASLYRSRYIIPRQDPNLGKHADCALIVIKPYKADKILHLILFHSNFWRAPSDGRVEVMWIWNESKDTYALMDKAMTNAKYDYSSEIIIIDVDILVQEIVGKTKIKFTGLKIQSGSALAASYHEHRLSIMPMEYCLHLLGPLRSLSFMTVNREAKKSWVFPHLILAFFFFSIN